MPLPFAQFASIERSKIVDYLLNPTHPEGESKARFFLSFGFSAERWEELEEALRQHGATQPLVRTTETAFGPRYEIEGLLQAPTGRPRVRTVWQVDEGELAPRLITAYPAPRQP